MFSSGLKWLLVISTIMRDFFEPDDLGVFVDHARRDLRHGYGKRSLQFEGKVLAVFKISVRDIPVLRRRKHGVAELYLAVKVAVFRAGADVFNDRSAVASENHNRILTPFSFSLRNVVSLTEISLQRSIMRARQALSAAFFASS